MGLQSLEQLEYLHRDVKPTNILVRKDGKYKIADYGTCCRIDEASIARNRMLGTYAYFPPEIAQVILKQEDIMPKAVTIKADMWAFGITLIEIVTGNHPCHRPNFLEQLLEIVNWTPHIDTECISSEIKSIILRL